MGTCEVFATRIKPAKIKYFLVYDYFPSLYLKQVKFSVPQTIKFNANAVPQLENILDD